MAADGATANGIESFWSLLKRAHKGVFHKMSSKQLHRYVRDPMTTAATALVLVSGITRPSRGEMCWRGKGGPIGHRPDGEKATAKANPVLAKLAADRAIGHRTS